MTREQFQVLTGEIARRLGWIVEYDEDWDMFCTILDPQTGGGFYFRIDDYKHPDRFVIASYYPRDHKGHLHYDGGERVEITVSQKKNIDQIMKDINNKFMPKFNSILPKVLERNQHTLSADILKKNTLSAIEPALDHLPRKFHIEYLRDEILQVVLELNKDDTLKLIEFIKSFNR